MTSIADLHTHSSHSDGVLAPSEIVELAAARGVRFLALTDHDSLEGIAEAQAAAERHPGLVIVPGVELSCEFPGNEVHLLGLFVDTEDAALRATLERMQAARQDRGREMVERLHGLGVAVEWEDVEALAAGGQQDAHTSRVRSWRRAPSPTSRRRLTATSPVAGRHMWNALAWTRWKPSS